MLTPALRNSSLRNQRQLETATKINTSSCSPQKHQVNTVQQTMIMARLLHRIASCRSTAHDANMFSCPNTDRTQHVSETVQRRSTTNSIMVIRARQSQHRWKKECLLLGHRTGISLTILRDVSSDGVRPCQHVLLSQHRSHTTCRRNCSTSFHNKLNHGDGWLLSNSCIRTTRSCHCPRHLNLEVMGRFGLSPGTFFLATAYGMVSKSSVLPRGVMPNQTASQS